MVRIIISHTRMTLHATNKPQILQKQGFPSFFALFYFKRAHIIAKQDIAPSWYRYEIGTSSVMLKAFAFCFQFNSQNNSIKTSKIKSLTYVRALLVN